ncbi:MAG TPA: NADH-quinone oxidoreductase subunit I [Actinomycetota bacterium]|nr:NADH-quinone oxidoreductase subunit I [Actinomycetota bacterium]
MRAPERHPDDTAIREVEERQRGRFRLPTLGIIEAMRVTLRTMLSKAVTVQYPEERIELPERTRGVIALLEENCTVCMLCSKECPCWCIYIEGHKVQKPGKRKPVNELDRFAIDYGLCMYCGICVEVCPFDALHWSPYFEYNSYTYEGMIHESDVLQSWQEHVLPPPPLVEDAEEKARELQKTAHDKRAEGIWAVIREQDKKDAYLARLSGAPVAEPGSSDTPPTATPAMAAVQAPAAPEPATGAEAAAPQAAEPTTTPSDTERPVAAPAPAADLGDIPRVDPTNLPAGIGPVERGRLKKLAELQHRGEAPTTDPVDLVAVLKPILDQMRG